MRLRLTVRRNGVPEVKLMWNVEADTDFTVSHLLENVNDVVPLESAEWGLEDYAVEYPDGENGFECLHFQVVRDILKEDDKVLIRPLLTNDLRRRRLSGRHQITADGRHLVDGVAFGRPWLRAPVNRPGIELPPRKRARIAYRPNGDADIDGLATDSSIPTSEDEDYSYVSPAETSEDEEQLLLEGPGDKDEELGTVVGEGYVKDGTLDQEDTTLAPEDAVEDVSRCEDSPPLPAYPGETAPSLVEQPQPQTLSSILNRLKGKVVSSPVSADKKGAASGSGSSGSSDETSSEGSTGSSSEDSDSASSSDADSDGSSDSDNNDSEEGQGTTPGSGRKNRLGRRAPPSDSDSTSSPSEEEVKQRASSSAADRASSGSSDSDDSSDSSDLSDSSSDSSVDVTSKKHVATPRQLAFPKVNVQKTKTESPAALVPAAQAVPQEPKSLAAGTTPLTRTQKRNARKREARRVQVEIKAAAALPQGDSGAVSATGTTSQDDEFMKRRQALLESLEANSGAAVTPKKRKAPDEEAESKSAQNGSALPSGATQGSTASQRRMRFDLKAPGRFLFGALGFGGSKNKEEEEQIPDAQIPDAQIPDAQTNGHGDIQQTDAADVPEDPDAWKDKITYRAVECVREGVELSEPPFPFVQRWDPQQQVEVWFGNKRGGKGKRKQRNQAHYYEEDAGYGKKRKVSPWPEELEYDDNTNMDGQAVDEDDLGEDNAENSYDAPEDLPALPEDMTTLPTLARGEATPGMVVTWKQWLLSKATNWQPQFGNVTAVVLRLDEADGDALHVLLAKRDRNLDRNEKEYDPQTGQRIYGGFEAPDLDEEEGEEGSEDDGYRLVAFSDMMDPGVVQRPSADSQTAFGSFGADLPGDNSVVPESLPQDEQGDTGFEPFSMELRVPFSTDPVAEGGDSDAEQPAPTDPAEGKSQKNALDVPSAVSSVASGRRQPDPNSLPVSLELEMTVLDSAAGSPVDKKGEEGEGQKSRSYSMRKGQGAPCDTNNHPIDKASQIENIGDSASPVPGGNAEEIKPAGREASFFEMEDEFLPKNLRREASVGAAVKKEANWEREEEMIDLKSQRSPPRLILPDSSPPRFGSQDGPGGKKGRERRTSPFEVPVGSQVIDLVSEGDSVVGAPVGTPVSSQKLRNGAPRGSQRQNGTPHASQNGTPTQRRKGTPASQKRSQKGDSLPKGSGWVKKRKGWKAEAAV